MKSLNTALEMLGVAFRDKNFPKKKTQSKSSKAPSNPLAQLVFLILNVNCMFLSSRLSSCFFRPIDNGLYFDYKAPKKPDTQDCAAASLSRNFNPFRICINTS